MCTSTRTRSIGFLLLGLGLLVCCGSSEEFLDDGPRGPLPRGSLKAGKSDGASCAAFCGQKSPAGCWCDSKCPGYGDCCPDKVSQCDNKAPTCEGYCGKRSPDGCYCDRVCETHGDCCPDKAQQCDGTIDPCEGVTCDTPPAPLCSDANTLRTFAAVGQCSNGDCSYDQTDTTCGHGCDNGACLGDPCSGVTCAAPPPSTCVDANTLRTFAATGQCSSGECSYDHTDTSCPDGCAAGACAPTTCSWDAAFVERYGQAWNPDDVAFLTSDGIETRGLVNLDIARMANTGSASAIRVKNNPNKVVEVRLLKTNVYQVLATRKGWYLTGLAHSMWSEAGLGSAGFTEKTLKQQFAMQEPTRQQAVSFMRLMVESIDHQIPQSDRQKVRDAAKTVIYKLETGAHKPTVGQPHNHYTATAGGKTFEFQLSLSLGRPAELGVWPVDKSWKWKWSGYHIAPRCNGCASNTFDGKTFLHCDEVVTFHDAQQACKARGGNLAAIENELQGALVRSLYPSNTPWIGLSDQVSEGTFTWSSGAPVNYLAWAPGEPNNAEDKEDCVHLIDTNNKPTWNDSPCSSGRPYICELP